MDEIVLKKFFDDKMRQIDIARELNISKYKVSRIVTKNPRYIEEKERRKQENKRKNIKETKEIIEKQRKQKQMIKSQDDLILKNIHKTASIELSSSKKLSNLVYLKWNRSVYKYNKEKNRFEFREELEAKRSYDVPKYIKENLKSGKKI